MIQKLIKSLLEAAAYPEPTANVSLIETHVSLIFLTDDFAYKVKKPVDFGFLNFTTLKLRRFYCEEEVRLNRRLCPEIYLGVVELHRTAGGWSFCADGEVVDYAVKMLRLPEERMLSRLLEAGEIDPPQMEAIARVVARFHRSAETGPSIAEYGSPAVIASNWEENFSQTAPFLGETVSARDLALMRDYVERFLASKGALFRARVEGGFIRECDGDLHLGNICLTDRICIFDCIEFNERFRYLDTAADIAFLLMDLEFAGRPDLCPAFLAAYRAAGGDPGPAELMNFYQAYRAFVRGKVKSFRLREPDLPKPQLDEARETAARYFRLARGYCLRERLVPSLVITCGLMGTGKSALAKELSFQLGFSLERSDLIRKKLAGRPPEDGSEDGYGAGIYGASYNEATYRVMLERAQRSLAGGRGIVLDATFRRRSDRAALRAVARKLQVPFYVIETSCGEELVRERLERRSLRQDEVSDGRWELFPRQRAEFEPLFAGEAITVDSSQPLTAAVDQALREMGLMP